MVFILVITYYNNVTYSFHGWCNTTVSHIDLTPSMAQIISPPDLKGIN
ncbi:hypothetical protein [Methanobacterium subterraneum]|nr:hypothetical protein [Methanobacterium subterraneum]